MEEARRPLHPLARSIPEPLLQAARSGRGMGSESAASRGRRLEAGAGGGAGGGPRLGGGAPCRGLQIAASLRPASAPAPPPLYPAASVRGGPRGRWEGCLRERKGVRGDQGRCLGAGTEGDLSSENCRAWAEPPRRGQWSRVVCSVARVPKRGRGCWTPEHNKPQPRQRRKGRGRAEAVEKRGDCPEPCPQKRSRPDWDPTGLRRRGRCAWPGGERPLLPPAVRGDTASETP